MAVSMRMEMARAYREGAAAAREGAGVEACKYDVPSLLARAWIRGYVHQKTRPAEVAKA